MIRQKINQFSIQIFAFLLSSNMEILMAIEKKKTSVKKYKSYGRTPLDWLPWWIGFIEGRENLLFRNIIKFMHRFTMSLLLRRCCHSRDRILNWPQDEKLSSKHETQ